MYVATFINKEDTCTSHFSIIFQNKLLVGIKVINIIGTMPEKKNLHTKPYEEFYVAMEILETLAHLSLKIDKYLLRLQRFPFNESS